MMMMMMVVVVLRGVVVIVVDAEDVGDGGMADDVGAVEFDVVDVRTVERLKTSDEVVEAVVADIGLIDVAGDNDAGGVTNPCKNHFHLLGRRVLHFVGDDKGTLKGSTAHETSRRDCSGCSSVP